MEDYCRCMICTWNRYFSRNRLPVPSWNLLFLASHHRVAEFDIYVHGQRVVLPLEGIGLVHFLPKPRRSMHALLKAGIVTVADLQLAFANRHPVLKQLGEISRYQLEEILFTFGELPPEGMFRYYKAEPAINDT